jgi:hypothetical protein
LGRRTGDSWTGEYRDVQVGSIEYEAGLFRELARGVLHTEWTGKFDGLDYQVQGVEVVLTNAIRCVDERTCELVQRLDGRVIARVRLELSADGRMLTATSMGNAGTATRVSKVRLNRRGRRFGPSPFRSVSASRRTVATSSAAGPAA